MDDSLEKVLTKRIGDNMDLSYFFELQTELERRINKKYTDCDKIKKIRVAISVELCELFNEWKGFKYWSASKQANKEALLYEFVDVLQMILALGVELGIKPERITPDHSGSIYDKFFYVQHILTLDVFQHNEIDRIAEMYYFKRLLSVFLGMADEFKITDVQCHYAFCMKHLINLKRLKENY